MHDLVDRRRPQAPASAAVSSTAVTAPVHKPTTLETTNTQTTVAAAVPAVPGLPNPFGRSPAPATRTIADSSADKPKPVPATGSLSPMKTAVSYAGQAQLFALHGLVFFQLRGEVPCLCDVTCDCL